VEKGSGELGAGKGNEQKFYARIVETRLIASLRNWEWGMGNGERNTKILRQNCRDAINRVSTELGMAKGNEIQKFYARIVETRLIASLHIVGGEIKHDGSIGMAATGW
jgi:hypothetical protein